VNTTVGREQEVAAGLRDRALREKVPVVGVAVLPSMPGQILVECPDLVRLTNLVASVRHARGVQGPADGGAPIAMGADRLERALAGTALDEGETAQARGSQRPPALAPTRRRTPSPRRGGTAGGNEESAAATPATDARLPPVSKRAALLLNVAIVAPLAVIALGLVLAPRLFWDRFLYPYFWAPIEADANNVGGAAESYNVYDTAAYALLLVPAILLIYRVLERLEIRVDARFVAMLTPFLVLGGAARALEDAVYFRQPLTFAFISPIIYVTEALFVLALVVASWWVARVVARRGPAWGGLAWSAAFAPGAAALMFLAVLDDRFVTAPLPAPLVLAALACAFLGGLVLVNRPGGPSVPGLVAIAGLLLLSLAAYLIARWVELGGWFPHPASAAVTHLVEIPAILGLASLAAGLTLTGIWVLSSKYGSMAPMLSWTNALVLLGQFLDGTATFWGIDFFGYREKHVLPGFLIDATGTGAVMFPLKLAFVSFVFYVIDVTYRRELFDEAGRPSSYVGLLKLTVLALGMGPGTRDMLRLAMGV
jgi:uncharacterized membrane protein